MQKLLLEISREKADRMITEMETQGEVYGRASYPIMNDFRWGVCQETFEKLSDGTLDCCRGAEIVNTLKRRYGGCQSGLLWQDKTRLIWRLETVHYVFFRKKNDRVFSCLRNGVNRKRARSNIFVSKPYPPGCSPETIVDILLAYDKCIIAVDGHYDKVLTSYKCLKDKLNIIQEIRLVAEMAVLD